MEYARHRDMAKYLFCDWDDRSGSSDLAENVRFVINYIHGATFPACRNRNAQGELFEPLLTANMPITRAFKMSLHKSISMRIVDKPLS